MTLFDLIALVFFAAIFVFGVDRDYHRHWLTRLATILTVVARLMPHPEGQPNGLQLLVSALAFLTFIAGAVAIGGIRISIRSTRKARR